jgi:hypothetical protein
VIDADRHEVASADPWRPFEPVGRGLDAHPWLAVGVAAALGAALALVMTPAAGRAPRRERAGRTLGESALALVGAIAAGIVRDYAIDSVTAAAQRWAHARD